MTKPTEITRRAANDRIWKRRAIGVLGFVLVLVSTWLSAEDPNQPLRETPITPGDREHWSFQPLVRPPLPAVPGASWARTPVDLFILEKLAARELHPQPPAGRATLMRRLYFDLLGMPPSPDEIAKFEADSSHEAVIRLVDRLLASPFHGERWAQHWLDIARFAETDGFEHDKVRKDAWRYRDWVIDALNADLSYDEFVRLQLAADEVRPDDEGARIATVFCLAGPDMPDLNSQDERRHQLLNEMTATVGSVLLGLQMGCAQCHDHKYDPLSQADFYRMRAIFEPAVQVKKNESVSVLEEQKGKKELSYVYPRGDWRTRGPRIEPGFPRVVNLWDETIAPAETGSDSSGRRSALAQWITRDDHPLTARVLVNRLWQFHFGHGLSRTPSDFGVIGEAPSHPELLDWLAVEFVESGWSLKHLHRLILTSAVYQQASRPETPESSEHWKLALERDSSNYYLARFPRQRLSGEAIRDAMLVAAGCLNTVQGGPGVRPPLPDELVRVLLKDQWSVSTSAADHFRRSVYVFARRNLRYPIFEAFDRPDGNASCPQRTLSTTAPQSLLLLNSELSLELARRMAGRVLAESSPDPAKQVEFACQCLLGRAPSADESQWLTGFLLSQADLLRDEGRSHVLLATPLPTPDGLEPCQAASLTDLCLALMNASEFVYVE